VFCCQVPLLELELAQPLHLLIRPTMCLLLDPPSHRPLLRRSPTSAKQPPQVCCTHGAAAVVAQKLKRPSHLGLLVAPHPHNQLLRSHLLAHPTSKPLFKRFLRLVNRQSPVLLRIVTRLGLAPNGTSADDQAEAA
jgi:hypothetical protein